MLLAILLITLMFTMTCWSTSEFELFPVPLGDRKLLRCPLDADATEILWSRDGESYNANTLSARESEALLEVATPSLNGSVFECLAVYREGTAPVTVKSWLIIVEGSPSVVNPSLNPESADYTVSWDLSETTDADRTIFHLEVPESNFSATVNATQYRLPASVCSPNPCANCSVFITAENRVGRGDAVEVILRPAIECDASGGKNTSSDESIRGNNTAVVVTADELPSNATLSDDITMKVVLSVVLTVAFCAIMITVVLLVLCCSRPCSLRRRLFQVPSVTSSQRETAVVTKQVVTPEDTRDGSEACSNMCIRRRSQGDPPKSSTTRDNSFEVVVEQPMMHDRGLLVQVFLGTGEGSNLENGPQEDCIDLDPNLSPLAHSRPLRASTPLQTRKETHSAVNSGVSGVEGDSREALLGNDSSHEEHATQYPRQESHQGHSEAGNSPCHVFHKVSSASSFLTLEGTIAVGITDNV